MAGMDVNWQTTIEKSKQKTLQAYDVVRHFLQRCNEDEVTMTAGHLAYVTLLSLVPMIAVSFAMFSAFPVFGDLRGDIEAFVYSNFVPTAGDTVSQYMNDFVSNASKTTSIGILALVFVAFMLMSAIDKALNRIWRIKKKRRLMMSLSIYWMILTMGPILASASIAATSYLVSLNLMGDVSFIKTQSLKLFPFLLSTLVFMLIYLLVPNKDIKIKHGFFGALLAAFLFEVGKRAFAIYIAKFTAYQAIYGALAAVPIIFVWIYISWVIVLLGAEFTATLDERQAEAEKAK
ncbi:virulence factor BrkB family protein [Echinimonas agarilytica]|uniref:UPF0761 membrane protein NAF29_15265 n=1 Tax=Echinimonas agarilytica TaxID=1215918 RepID=A0AA41W9Y3_9GAMM|nr:virulence factor BrkB family protein [Echinimonas agarilytica]MCM2681013.1 virulence factor BrkB family protein [Echinimonas agarilytica]